MKRLHINDLGMPFTASSGENSYFMVTDQGAHRFHVRKRREMALETVPTNAVYQGLSRPVEPQVHAAISMSCRGTL